MKLKSKLRPLGVLFFLLGGAWVGLALGAAKITSVDFKNGENEGILEIRSDGPLSFEKQENASDKQIIVEIKGAKILPSASRKLDTSSFPGNVSLVSPYQVEGQEDTARVVIQLRQEGSAEVAQDGNILRVKLPHGTDVASSQAAKSPATPEAPPVASAAEPDKTLDKAPEKASGDKTLDVFAESQATRRFIGKPVTLQVRDADVNDVLRLIADASGFNVIVGDDVKGKVTLSMVDVPWDQALDVVLRTMKLGAERSNNLLRIVTLSNLTTEKTQELQAKKAAQASAPRVTRVFPISYADPNDLQVLLVKFGAQQGSGGGTAGDAASGGASVQVDKRTNNIVVQDIPENIERMKKLVELLDTQTPQVMIEAKVVEASENFSKSLSGNLGIGATSGKYFASVGGGANPTDALVGTPGVFSDGNAIGTGPTGNNRFGVSLLAGAFRINALLNLAESESQIRLVSAPKTVVLNKQSATIVQGTPVLVPKGATIAGVGNTVIPEVQSANLSMTVKPTVTNDGNVLMDLTVTRDVPQSLGGGQSGIGSRSMTTSVVVESGTTLVIGGIYTMRTNQESSGFPILRKIPLIGWLFGSESSATDKSELFFFITPRILNVKEAGISSPS
ncbi:type IV pilus secretin PilQ [Bdellovibrionota bacterium FG-2]